MSVLPKNHLIDLPFSPPELQAISTTQLIDADIHLKVLRLDTLNSHISGNKWFKLKHNLRSAREQGKDVLLSFGGAYSNHIHALAAAGAAFGFKTIGIIRGEIDDPENKSLAFARQQGMELHAVSRSNYRNKHEQSFIDDLREKHGDFYLIPEGGSNPLALAGCAEIASLLRWERSDSERRFVILPCGTGATLAGIVKGSRGDFQVIGIPVLKGAGFLNDDIRVLLSQCNGPIADNWRLELDFHFGGYAKFNNELLAFIEDFYGRTKIPLEPVYSGKMFFAVERLIAKEVFPGGSEIIALHTGGLQTWQAEPV